MDRERTGQFDKMAPRPPSNGTLTRNDLSIGEAVEFEISGSVIMASLDARGFRLTVRAIPP